ncbi:MAG: response regulator transcription factor [Prevotellaceae bacterium]|jgi:DNA-binding NarL/FixJ family response regulator|nr:response regulator transcription factor [Prevotellaceae bacterium]
MKKVIIADNQDITSLGLQFICKQIPDVEIAAGVSNKAELKQKLTLFPDAVVLLDYTLFDLISVDELAIIQDRFSEAFWLLFSDRLSEYFVRRLSAEKHVSIVLKEASSDEILAGINAALHEQQYFCSHIKSMLQTNKEDSLRIENAGLTSTEKDILKLIAMGKSTKEIAIERFSSIHTVATHRKNIFRKLDINNMYEATKYALHAGIIVEAEYYI